MNDISYIRTTNNLTVFFDGRPHTIPLTDHRVSDIEGAIRENDTSRLRQLLNFKQTVANVSEGRIAFDGLTRSLTFNGNPLHNAILDRLVTLFEQKLPIQGHLKFLDRLMNNPSFRAVKELYRFIEACDLPITSDGYFLAYKIVRNDYMDCYTGTFDNSVGSILRVERNQVDEDSNRTCSYGLHACSREYLPHYGSGNGRIMVVKIDPADVVAVPEDYNNAKLRRCGYEVVSEIPRDEALSGLGMERYHTDSYGSDDPDDYDDSDDYHNVEGYDDYDVEFELDDSWDIVGQPTTVTTPVAAPTPVLTGKLTDHQVKDIVRLLDDGEMSIASIGRLYNVNESTVRKIRDGLIWGHVTGR